MNIIKDLTKLVSKHDDIKDDILNNNSDFNWNRYYHSKTRDITLLLSLERNRVTVFYYENYDKESSYNASKEKSIFSQKSTVRNSKIVNIELLMKFENELWEIIKEFNFEFNEHITRRINELTDLKEILGADDE